MKTGGRLAGRTALITGGSRGIGFHIAACFAAQGADVVIAATNAAKLATAREELVGYGTKVETEIADVSDREACFGLVERTIAKRGRLDILVNCAAVYIPKPFTDYSFEEFSRVVDVDLFGPFHMMQAALPHMIAAKYGKIVNIASTAGKWGSVNQAAYNTSKHGLVGMTRCVALETAKWGITVNAICPGMVETDLAQEFQTRHAALAATSPEHVKQGLLNRIPIGRFLHPAEIGHLAVYLASTESDGMTGQSILLDGGMLMI